MSLNSATAQQVRDLTAIIKEKDEEIAFTKGEFELKTAQLKKENEHVIAYLNSEDKVSIGYYSRVQATFTLFHLSFRYAHFLQTILG